MKNYHKAPASLEPCMPDIEEMGYFPFHIQKRNVSITI